MGRIFIIFIVMFSYSLVYSQGTFAWDKKSGKYSFQREWNQYDGKVSADTFIIHDAGKWLIQNEGLWGIFYTELGLLLPEAYDTIVILTDNKYGVLQDSKWALFDPKGNMSAFLFDNLVSYSNDEAYVQLNGEWGYYQHETFFNEYLYFSELDEKPRIRDLNYPGQTLTDRELLDLLAITLKYPAIARENGIQGKVVATVFISDKGELEHVEIYESVHESLDTEVLRVINEHFYLWSPGILAGQAVPSQTQLPIRFRLE